ncbi:MAG: hypothetical protein KatS3mg035_0791 [Bacteroidia bacterium]|nr:MAG: hypothetical protein KatS3mg035_0791 [Bacteroidia bacterium]
MNNIFTSIKREIFGVRTMYRACIFFRAFPHIKVLCNISKNGSYVLLGIPDSKIQEYKEKLREKNWEINNQSSNETFLEFVGVEKIEKEEYEMFLHTQMSKQKEKETQKSRIIVISNEKNSLSDRKDKKYRNRYDHTRRSTGNIERNKKLYL